MTYSNRFFGLLLATVAASSYAQEHAHVHGEGILTMAVEAKRLVVALGTPTDSLWGFEHPAATKEEQAKVDEATKRLADGRNVLQLPAAAKCKQAGFKLEAEKAEHEDEHEGEHAAHGAEKNEKHEQHQDVVISYEFDCAAPELITPFDVTLFKNFPGYQHLRVQWVDKTRQLEKELNAKSITFTLDQ
jgi:hypothetical protein